MSHFKHDLPIMAYGRWYLFRASDIQKGKGNLSFRSVRRSLTAGLTDTFYGCENEKKILVYSDLFISEILVDTVHLQWLEGTQSSKLGV